MTTHLDEAHKELRFFFDERAIAALDTYMRAILAESRPSSERPATAGGAPSDEELTRIYEDALRATRHHTRDKWFVECLRALYEAGERAERERNERQRAHETHKWSGPLVIPTVCTVCGVDYFAEASFTRCAPPPPAPAEKCPTCGDKFPEFCSAKPEAMHSAGKSQAEKCPEPLPVSSDAWRCSCCGELMDNTLPDGSWRWNGTAFEHWHGQGGYFVARNFGTGTAEPGATGGRDDGPNLDHYSTHYAAAHEGVHAPKWNELPIYQQSRFAAMYEVGHDAGAASQQKRVEAYERFANSLRTLNKGANGREDNQALIDLMLGQLRRELSAGRDG